MPSLESGGAEKSLVNLLNLLDYDEYDVDLLLLRREGIFLEEVPEQVNIISSGEYADFDGGLLRYCFKHPCGALNRLNYGIAAKKRNRRRLWRAVKRVLPQCAGRYYAAIGYLEGLSHYYCVDCVQAEKKIGFVHLEYSRTGLDSEFDRDYFEKLDYIMTVSASCAEELNRIFPEFKEKIRTKENPVPAQLIKKKAEEAAEEFDGLRCLKLLTVGRLSERKGYFVAIDAAERLKRAGIDFKWFAIGTGELEEAIRTEAVKHGLEDKFILLGEKANPYPYIRACDIYVQPSLFEGKPIAVEEAKILEKPIVVTTAASQGVIKDKTALVAEINGKSVAESIAALLAVQGLDKCLKENLKAMQAK